MGRARNGIPQVKGRTYIGVDPASKDGDESAFVEVVREPDGAMRVTNCGRAFGKTAAQEKAIAAYLKRNPGATIARVSGKTVLVEKPTEGSHEFIEPKALPDGGR